MGLTSALNLAVSGLANNQRETDLVSQNVARGDQAGYTRKRLISADFVGEQGTIGLRARIEREVDLEIQRQITGATSITAFTRIQAKYTGRLDQLFGNTNATNNLSGGVSALIEKLQSLAASPDNLTDRLAAVNQAKGLAAQFNQMSATVQDMRTQVEAQIASSVEKVNKLTRSIAEYNERITSGKVSGQDVTSFEDARDLAVKELSTLVDIDTRVDEPGRMTVFTRAGLTLVDSASVDIHFNQTGTLTADTLWNADPTKRGVGTITVGKAAPSQSDVIAEGLFRSGEIAALIDVRDRVLVQAQNQLDQLAASLASTFSDRTVQGTAATSGAQTGFDLDLTDLKAGNPITLTVRDGAENRTIRLFRVDSAKSLPLPADTTADPKDTVIGVDFSGGIAGVVSQIQSALGSGFTVGNPSGQTLQILDDGAANKTDVTGLSARVTQTALTGGAELPLFTDGITGIPYTGRLDGAPQQRGFAARLSINPAVLDDPSVIVKWQGAATLAGDNTRPNRILDQLRKATFEFGGTTGIVSGQTSFTATVTEFANSMIDHWGSVSEQATAAQGTQDTIQANLEARFSATSSVSIDQELSRLIQLQSSYSANARVMTTVNEMLKTLMSAI